MKARNKWVQKAVSGSGKEMELRWLPELGKENHKF